jgi:hypothetical protein
MALPSKGKSVQVGHVTFIFTCIPEPSETEYNDTSVRINDMYFCSITWADLDNFIKEIQSTVGKYSI